MKKLKELYYQDNVIIGSEQNFIKLAKQKLKASTKEINEFLKNDWMHETARCIGYPSDSTRAARERGRGAACGHRPCRPGPVRPARAPHLLRPCLSPGGSSLTLAPVAQVARSPRWLKTHARRASGATAQGPNAAAGPEPGIAQPGARVASPR
jgi:hypothetical protein